MPALISGSQTPFGNQNKINVLESKASALGTNTTFTFANANDSKKTPKAKALDFKKTPKAKALDSKKTPKAKALDSKKTPKAKTRKPYMFY